MWKRRLTLGGKIAGDTSNNAEENAGPGVEETRGGSSSDETRNGARAPADHGPLLCQAVVEQAPGHGGEHASEDGVPASHSGTQVSTEGGATVEAEPANHEQNGAESDEGDVVGTEVHHHLLVAAAKNPGVGESGHAGTDLDGNTTGVVEDAVNVAPAVRVPNPVGQRTVDEGGPEEDKDHGGNDATALGNGTNGEGGSDGAEHHLVEGVEKAGNERAADGGSTPNALETEVEHVADDGVASVGREGEGEAPEEPLESDDAEGHHDDPEHGEGRLSAGETRVEKSDTGNHHEDENGGNQNEGLVTGLVPLVEVLHHCINVLVLLEITAMLKGELETTYWDCRRAHRRCR